MKRYKLIAGALALSLSCAMLAGCGEPTAYVTAILPAETTNAGTNYTVTYSDGRTQTITVANGKDGKNGEDGVISIDEVYAKYQAVYGEISYADFLDKYLSLSTANTSAIAKCLQSSMKVHTTFVESSSVIRPGMGGWTTAKSYGLAHHAGSAVIYKIEENDTYIVTNYHVVYDNDADIEANGGNTPKDIYCYLYGSEDDPILTKQTDGVYGYSLYDFGEYGIPCTYVGGSITSDIAVLKAKTSDIAAINADFHAVTLAGEYCVGETAIAIGNPEGEGISVTKGIVSVDNENIALKIDNVARYYRSLRIDTSLYSGNSGGGLFNEKGELIGITNAGNQEDQNINYAIPIGIAAGTADNIIYYDRDGDNTTNGAYKITVGVTVQAENIKYVYNAATGRGNIREDVVATEITDGSIAESIGIQVGDKLVAFQIDGTEYDILRNFDVSDLLLKVRAGASINFRYIRGESEPCLGTPYTVPASALAAIP
ncbi:MAG: S1C family serine protease [Clostridia bacterium]|nr:S1C family serine protease [Clostridia bacterium]